MPRFISPFDGAQLFYRDYQPTANPLPFQVDKTYADKQKPALVFIHGWPMSSLMFEQQTLPLCETYRFRCIAPDRRGFGQSDWNGAEPGKEQIDYNVFAQDTVHLLETLDIGPFVFVAASMGPGETLLAYERSEYVRSNCKVRKRLTHKQLTASRDFLTRTGHQHIGVLLDRSCPSISPIYTRKPHRAIARALGLDYRRIPYLTARLHP